MKTMNRRIAAIAAVAVLGLGGAACSDEDGDGATTDEEVDQIDEGAEDTGEQLEEEVNEGEEEAEE